MNHPLEDQVMDISEAVETLVELAREKQTVTVAAPAVNVAAPNVSVDAPIVNVAAPSAPNVTVNTPAQATKWICEITERDYDGRIKKITFTAEP